MGAALLVSQLQAFLKAGVRSRLPIPSVMANTNVLVHESTSPERFATLVYAELDTASRTLVYSNAGHNYPILIRGDGRCELLDCGGLVLGVMPSVHYDTGDVVLERDDVLLFYTDGLSELQDPNGEEYGEARLIRFIKDNRHLDPEELKNRLIREVTRFALGAIGFDDLTMVILKMCDGPNMLQLSPAQS
jgi:sigma-B regulation protein RsbU (phosphoserine phosphatase)